jgi:hypothetical protein
MDRRVIPISALLAVALIGQVLLWASNQAYYQRTKDRNFLRFWLYRHLLTRKEYVVNRIGFALALTSFIGIAAVWLALG